MACLSIMPFLWKNSILKQVLFFFNRFNRHKPLPRLHSPISSAHPLMAAYVETIAILAISASLRSLI